VKTPGQRFIRVAWGAQATGFISATLLFGGCLNPSHLQPVAQDNRQNLAHLQANNAQVRALYLETLHALAEVEELLRVRKVQREIIARYGDDDQAQIHLALRQQVVDMVKANPNPTEQDRRRIAMEHPIAGDIAMGFISLEEGVAICRKGYDLSTALKRNLVVQSGYLQALGTLFEPVGLVRFWRADTSELFQVCDAYFTLLARQETLAREHAESFVRFANDHRDFQTAVHGTLAGSAFQGNLLDTLKDERARERVGAVLRIITNFPGSSAARSLD
jgi:hypothetical protein